MTLAANWPELPADRARFLSWLEGAWRALRADARAWFGGGAENEPLAQAIERFASEAESLRTDAPSAEIDESVLRYVQLRSSLFRDGHDGIEPGDVNESVRVAPAIDAAVPWVTMDRTPPSASLSGTSWGAAVAQAHRLYPATDPMRRAVDLWAEEYRTGNAAGDERFTQRYSRLLAWVRSRMQAEDAATLGTTGPTQPMPVDAYHGEPPPPPPSHTRTATHPRAPVRTPRAPSRSGGAGVAMLAALVILAMSNKRRGRKRRAT